tara:strand:- start:1834 stop:2394 length:561 start_codon:yes stop_codon:yes gene_type:complete
MRNLTATLCLTLTILLGSAGMSESADFQKGLTALNSGDYATALREFRPLAEQGHAKSQFNLGWMYNYGRGVPQNYKTAVKWYKFAAKQGVAFAQFNLGVMYEDGEGVPQNYKTAVKWYRLAAEQGWRDAQWRLNKIKARLVSKGIDDCLYEEVAKITGPESKKIVEKHCRNKLEKKSLDWLLRKYD